MEHLRLPSGATVSESEQAPYIAEPYDGGTFLEYPSRSRFRHIAELFVPSYRDRIGDDDDSDLDLNQLEIFLQTWLVFGVIHEMFGPAVTPEMFVERSADGTRYVLNSERLPFIMKSWCAKSIELRGTDAGNRLLDHLTKCFRTAWDTITEVTLNVSIDPRVLLTTASILESIERTTAEILRSSVRPNLVVGKWTQFYDKEILLMTMAQNGWCPADLSIDLDDPIGTIQLWYYLSKVQQPGLRDHSKCDQNKCYSRQIDMNGQNIVHRCARWDCDVVHIDVDSIMAALDRGYIGLLDISGNGPTDCSIQVTSTEHHQTYVALSHVWADGLRNPTVNALPRCQLNYIALLLTQLEDCAGCGKLMLWFDTLCCPVRSKMHRQMCLMRMSEIYENATYVLIIDLALSKYSRSDLDDVELAARLLTSGWMKRLWTMQEGFLANQLWVQTKDGPVDLATTITRLEKVRSLDPLHCALISTLCLKLELLRGRDDKSSGSRSMSLEVLFYRLRHREVSVAADEPLCLCTCLDIGQEDLVKSKGSERMSAFWRAIQKANKTIPSNILFFKGSRLERPGLRWAPASLLPPTVLLSPGSHTKTSGQMQFAEILASGLKIKLSGFELRFPELTHRGPFASQNVTALYARHSDGAWSFIDFMETPTPELGPRVKGVVRHPLSQLVVIYDGALTAPSQALAGDGVAIGLLGVVESKQAEMIVVRSLSCVQFGMLWENETAELEDAWQLLQAERSRVSSQSLPLKKGLFEQELVHADDHLPKFSEAHGNVHAPSGPMPASSSNNLGDSTITTQTNWPYDSTLVEVGAIWPADQCWCVD